jgi:o-succinylbenzoate synthase
MRVLPFALDLRAPLGTANGEIDRREGFLVAVDPSDGDDVPVPGVGEATPLPGWTESLSACESALRAARRKINEETGASAALNVLDPTEVPAARHGLALALGDAAARDDERSLATWLAAEHDLPPPADSVPVNATIGDGSPATTASAAERAVAAGFDCVKVKVGVRDLDEDVDRLRAVRRTVGPAVGLRADANGAWDRQTAEIAVERLATLNIAYLEQPLPAADLAGAAALRESAHGEVPIALDESVAECGLEPILAAGAADAAVLKPMALGGPDRALAAAIQAREAGVDPVVTTTIDAVVARTAAVHVAAAIPDIAPCGLATGSLFAGDLATDPCPVDAGSIAVPTADGIAGETFDSLSP